MKIAQECGGGFTSTATSFAFTMKLIIRQELGASLSE